MGDLLAFHQRKAALGQRCEPLTGAAEIILFPGVRYERMDEEVQPQKLTPRRAHRRRDKTKKEKAS